MSHGSNDDAPSSKPTKSNNRVEPDDAVAVTVIAARAMADRRTVKRRLRGDDVRGAVQHRIDLEVARYRRERRECAQ